MKATRRSRKRSRQRKNRSVENHDATQQPAWQQIGSANGKGKNPQKSHNALPNQVGKRYWRM